MQISQQLFEKAKTAMENAYAPYSKYHVGAAVYTESGKIFASCNVENVSYPCGTCAEAGAIATMVANGETKIAAVLVISGGRDLVYPCGACLQRLAEFATKEMVVYLADNEKICKTYHLTDLLPHNFTTTELVHD